MNLKRFEVSKQNTILGSRRFHHLASTHQIRSAVRRQTAGHVCSGFFLRLTQDLTGCHREWEACQPAAVASVQQSGPWPLVQVSPCVCERHNSVSVGGAKEPACWRWRFWQSGRRWRWQAGARSSPPRFHSLHRAVHLSRCSLDLLDRSWASSGASWPPESGFVWERICDEGKQQDWRNNRTSIRQTNAPQKTGLSLLCKYKPWMDNKTNPNFSLPHVKGFAGHRHTTRR